MIVFLFLALAVALLSAQVQLSELRLLSGRYSYRMQKPQAVTMIASVLTLLVVVIDLMTKVGWYVVWQCLIAAFVWLVSEWLLSRLSPHRLVVSVVWRVVVVAATAIFFLLQWSHASLLPFVFIGLWLRNTPLGLVHGKDLFLACHLTRYSKDEYRTTCSEHESLRKYNVAEYGILPDTGRDVLADVQELINKIGGEGGGCLFFPRGRYLFNKQRKSQFLQINYSHVTLEGECDEKGKPLAELVNCGPTVCGERNPWLSPFFITTGEELQPSNVFWGLDFRNPKGIHLESSSLSDPGSDGIILTPPFATVVTADALAGATMLSVEDSSKVGKYILLGMYNTDHEGMLVKELLGVEEFRDEWLTARRAGEEEAPSFQWLVEVKRVVDAHTIELSRPLLRDCLMKWQPAIFNVELLEDIHIRHLCISSRWNGLFHHHGLPLYYNVSQAQEMDYGWNGINMKRAAHSTVENVEMLNFTNPLYVQDSRDVRMERVDVGGYDGHQGLKVYCHTCDCLFRDITFRSHFADMMGGEGNAYANTFSQIRYVNPVFNPVDYDFHGFAEGPFGPPAYNCFEYVEGFRYIKGAGAPFMQPALAVGNRWQHCYGEGERRGTQLFFAMSYREKRGLTKYVTAVGYTVAMMLKNRCWSPVFAAKVLREKLTSIDRMGIPRSEHGKFFPQTIVEDVVTTASGL